MKPAERIVALRMLCAGLLFLAVLAGGEGCRGNERLLVGGGPTIRQTTGRIRGFDPAHAGDMATVTATGKIYEGLLQYDCWARPYRVEPLLAAAMPEVSADGLVWRIRLREGIEFADDPCFVAHGGRGRELQARDFVYSILRIADVKVGSGGYWAFRGRIEGLDAFRAASQGEEPTDYDVAVAGLRATGRYELEIRLTAPYPQLPWVLAMPYAFIVPREAVEFYGAEFVNHPVGSGPYVLAAARQNYRYEYRINPKWAAPGRVETLAADAPTPDAGKRLPLTPRIVDVVVGDPSTAWLMFLSGQLDWVDVSRDHWDSILTAEHTLRLDLAARGIVLEQAPQLAVSYTAFNMDDPVVGANPKLRQALSCAFDAPQWRDFQHGRVEIATEPLPPGVAGYGVAAPPYAFDLERAQRLLEEAGYPQGRDPATGRRLKLTLELGSADNPEARQAAELLASFMERIGVVVEPSYNNWPAFLQKIERRQAQMFSVTWVGDYPDAQNFLQLFASENVSPGPNRANYVNPDFDRLYQQMVALPESPEREALCRKAVAVVLEDCPWILTGYPVAVSVRQAQLGNRIRHDFPWGMEKYWRVEE
ncbi:MAG: ABC transporter substrate-binding protein [Kiritimatiellia bacterium]|jgi:ABC-type transport system substrate-binding protein|nr:ABC transporter substrate-binding protein [Kiritimatiellia bacterium]